MNDRLTYHYYQHEHERQAFENRCRALEEELKRKNDTIDKLRSEIVHCNQRKDLSRSTSNLTEQSSIRNSSQHSNIKSSRSSLNKDREIAKLKALIFEKDNELIALTSSHKNILTQMEERMERERKVWNDHKDLLLASERVKFEEEKTRLIKDLQDQFKLEQERCQRLEKKLYDAQMQSSEAQLMLKESGRERINAVYGTKEQCRKEFQDEITRLRNQFQLEKNIECAHIQERICQLEDALNQASMENADTTVRQHELFLNLEISEKTCVRSINDGVKKLLMAIDSPTHVYATIPNTASFRYDRESIVERLPTRSALKLLQDTIDDVRNYIVQQKVQTETRTKFFNQSKILSDQSATYSNTNRNYCPQSPEKFFSRDQRENDSYFRNIDRLSQPYNHDHYRSQNNVCNPFQLLSEQNNTIDNLVQKLEDHIASELNRLTKQRMTLNTSNHHDEWSTACHLNSPSTQIKCESIPASTSTEANQDSLIRHLQDRISDLRNDNMRLRDNEQLKTLLSTH